MKKGIILICVMTALLFPLISYAEDEDNYIIGEIRELVQWENVIQVGERNYIVEMVLVDFGMGEEPVMGSMSDLKERSLVKVYVKGKGENYWIAEKVVVFEGKKREEMLKQME